MTLTWTHRAHTPAYSLWSAVDAHGEVVAQVVREGRYWHVNRHCDRKGLERCASLREGKAMAEQDAAAREVVS